MNNNETILKLKDVKYKKKPVETSGEKEEILKVIDFDDNMKSKNVVKPIVKAEKPIVDLKEGTDFSTASAVEIPNVEATRDYEITDLCDIIPIEAEFTKPPVNVYDISEVLAIVDRRLTESQGAFGIINVLFTRSSKDRICESALLEFRTRGKVYSLLMTITEGSKPNFFKLRVNNTLGKKIFERETKRPAMLVESYLKAINFKVLAESVLLNKTELVEAATPVLTTIKRFLKKENLEGLVDVVPQGDTYLVSITTNEDTLERFGTEYCWKRFAELYDLIKRGFPSVNTSDINEGSFTIKELNIR